MLLHNVTQKHISLFDFDKGLFFIISVMRFLFVNVSCTAGKKNPVNWISFFLLLYLPLICTRSFFQFLSTYTCAYKEVSPNMFNLFLFLTPSKKKKKKKIRRLARDIEPREQETLLYFS